MSGEFQSFLYMSPSAFSGRFTQLHEFLDQRQLALLQKCDEKRNKIDSLDALQTYARTMRETFIQKIGGIPARDCPLDAKTVDIIDMGDYVIESVIYQARDRVYVPSSLYMPKGLTEPSAAVLFLSGHSDHARMSVRYQEVCQTLACAGLIVFAIDMLGQGERKDFYDPETFHFEFGKAISVKEYGTDLTIISSGIMLGKAAEAAEILKDKGVKVRLLDMMTLKPLDEEAVIRAAKETGAILTVEDHSVINGLGAAVASVVVQNQPVPVKIIGIPDRFGESGDPELLYRDCHMDTASIVEEAMKLAESK